MVRRFIISGTVQGVGYRNYTMKKARELGVQGWVRNLSDGRVEVLACCAEIEMGQLEKLLRRGPVHANVLEIKVFHEILRTQLADLFEVRYAEG